MSWQQRIDRAVAERREAQAFRQRQPLAQGAGRWLDADYALMAFAPARMSLSPGEGPPHIRLDRAAEFLIGDRL